MIVDEHPQVIAIILSVLEDETAADVLTFLPPAIRPQVIRRIALLDTVQPNAMAELESVMAKQLRTSTTSSAAVGVGKRRPTLRGKTKLDIETSVMADISGEDEDLASVFRTTCLMLITWWIWTIAASKFLCALWSKSRWLTL